MRVVLDTNVLLQGLKNKNGASGFILENIRSYHLELMISIPVFSEYQDVLLRKSSLKFLGASKLDIEKILDFIAFIASPAEINFLMRPNLKDESDNMFVDLAFASRANFLITSNVKDYNSSPELLFDSFKIILPTNFAILWRKLHE